MHCLLSYVKLGFLMMRMTSMNGGKSVVSETIMSCNFGWTARLTLIFFMIKPSF